MAITKTPVLVQKLFRSLLWRVPTKNKELYLTFDDGPIPDVTLWVLAELEKYNAKATFFCIGNNIQKYPEIYKELVNQGHSIGNHTHNHYNCLKVGNRKYITNIEKCQETILNNTAPTYGKPLNLFRPPYGKFKPFQIKKIAKNYRVVLWDVLSRDFDVTINPEKCLVNVTKHAKPGSIIVFHDSLKAANNLKYTLPKVLEHYTNLGYTFKAL